METYMFEYHSKKRIRRRIGVDDWQFHRTEFEAGGDDEAFRIVETKKQEGCKPSRLLKVIKTNW